MNQDRKPLSVMEKSLLKANSELVSKQREMLRDISRLISYIKGNKNLKNEVKNIIIKYTRKYDYDRE